MSLAGRLVTTIDQLNAVAKAVQTSPWVAIDTETTGLHPYGGDELRGICIAAEGFKDGVYVPVSHYDRSFKDGEVMFLVEHLSNAPGWQLFHHALFDWAFLYDWGFEPRTDRFVDTKVTSWFFDENRNSSLKVLGKEFLSEDADDEQRTIKALLSGKVQSPDGTFLGRQDYYKRVREHLPELPAKEARKLAQSATQKRGWGDLLAEEIAPYAAKDAWLTWRLADVFLGPRWNGYKDGQLPEGLQREYDFQLVLFRMIHRGIRVDPQQLGTASIERTARLEAIDEELQQWWSGENRFNPGSTKQKAQLLHLTLGLPSYRSTPTGRASVDKQALHELAERHPHPALDLLLEHAQLSKAMSAYVVPLQEHARKSIDGRIHAHFSSTRTVTGRLSCSDPNLMTIPREGTAADVRAAFVPGPGKQLWEYDLGQAELRVAAALSGDEQLYGALTEEGRDLHSETSIALFGDASPENRVKAKAINFGTNYGAGPRKIAELCDVSEEKGVDLFEQHKRTYPKLHAMSDSLAAYAEEHGEVHFPWPGRRRHFNSPGLPWYQRRYYTAMNALVQGSVGELVKDVMLEWEWSIGVDCELLLQVHDALVFEVVNEEYAHFLLAWLNRTTAAVNPFNITIPWEAKRWA